jgi:hypothetical protein
VNYYRPKPCATCGKTYHPTGGKNMWCSMLCRVLDCCDVSSDIDACWPWNRSFDCRGYGEIRLKPVTKFAHRIMFEQFTRMVLTRSEVIRHSCDNPPCCNPFHLEAGTQADNVRDMLARGRGQDYSTAPKGEAHGMASISDETALEIFKAPGRLDEIKSMYGVSRDIVEKIKYGFSWNHVTGMPKKRKTRSAA